MRVARPRFFVCVGVLSVLCSTSTCSRASELQRAPYQIVASIPGGDADGVWDYATVDLVSRRLFLAQDGVTVLDLDTGKVTPHFTNGKALLGAVPTHNALAVNDGKTLALSVVATNSVDFHDAQTGKYLSSVTVGPPPGQNWHNPDQLLYEPKSNSVISIAGDSSALSLINARTFIKMGEVPVGKGKLEAAAADGTGLVYVNEAETGNIAVIDVLKRKMVRQIKMKGCEEPTGLVYDVTHSLVVSVCSNGVVKFIASESGNDVASIKVGAGSDGLVYDPERHVVFSFGGDDGTLSVISVPDRMSIALIQTLKTKPGARLGVLDSKTGRVYIPSATFGPPAAPITLPGLGTLPGLNPHTFEFIVVAPNSP